MAQVAGGTHEVTVLAGQTHRVILLCFAVATRLFRVQDLTSLIAISSCLSGHSHRKKERWGSGKGGGRGQKERRGVGREGGVGGVMGLRGRGITFSVNE